MYSIEEAIKFANSIPMDDLVNEIKRVTGLQQLKISYKIETQDELVYIHVFSNTEVLDIVPTFFKMFIFNTNINSSFLYIKYDDSTDTYYLQGNINGYVHLNSSSVLEEFTILDNVIYKNNAWKF